MSRNLKLLAVFVACAGILIALAVGIPNSFATTVSCLGDNGDREAGERIHATALFKDRYFQSRNNLDIDQASGSGLLAKSFAMCSTSRIRDSAAVRCTTSHSDLHAVEYLNSAQVNTYTTLSRRTGIYKVEQKMGPLGPFGRSTVTHIETGVCEFRRVFLPPWNSEPIKCRTGGPEIRYNFDLDRAYPAKAMKRGIEGKVTVEYTVGVSGRVSSLKVLHADQSGYFERAVESEFERMRWYPATDSSCKPVVSVPQQRTLTFWLG